VTSRQASSQPTTTAKSSTPTQATVESTEPSTEITTTELTTTTSTTKPVNPKAECAEKYVLPGTVLYLYTEECCKALNSTVQKVSEKGYEIRYLDMIHLSTADSRMLLCFYSPQTISEMFVPQFVCTASGDSILLTTPAGASTKITNFAEECKQAV
jgi:hypothetical protein